MLFPPHVWIRLFPNALLVGALTWRSRAELQRSRWEVVERRGRRRGRNTRGFGDFGKEQLVVYGTCSRVWVAGWVRCVVLDILAQGPHPSTFLAPTSHWWWKGCMSLAPTGLHTRQPVGSFATAAVGSSHLVELLVALIVVIITTCWCCIRRACRSCGTRRRSIQLPSGFEVSINGTD